METVCRTFQNLWFRCGGDPRRLATSRKKVVVLGTGWSAMNFIRRIDVARYDVTIISPRDYFAFTPLLASACSGTLSSRACLEPIRDKLFRGGKKVMDFYEAWATELNMQNKSIVCKSKSGEEFQLPYDYLVVSVGAEVSTFGIPGVAETACFLKEVEHARTIRKKVLDHLEQASLPTVSDEAKKSLLRFVVVGGGPTGVESAAELADFIREDCSKHFPNLVPHIKITLVELLPKVLPAFSKGASEFSLLSLQKSGVETLMQCSVVGMTKESVTIMDANKKRHVLPTSFVLWASGVSQVPFSKTLIETIPEQKGHRILRVNERLQVLGGEPSIYGMGDCTYLTPDSLEGHTDLLYAEASKSSTGAGVSWLKSQADRLSKRFPQFHPVPVCLNSAVPEDHLSRKEFEQLVKKIDQSFKVPPPTAQTASQEGAYLASVFNRHVSDESKGKATAFLYHWKGFMAYVGYNQSVIDSPFGTMLGGLRSKLLWRGFYWSRQMSWNNKAICLMDWSKVSIRGRDVARDHSEGAIPKCPK